MKINSHHYYLMEILDQGSVLRIFQTPKNVWIIFNYFVPTEYLQTSIFIEHALLALPQEYLNGGELEKFITSNFPCQSKYRNH